MKKSIIKKLLPVLLLGVSLNVSAIEFSIFGDIALTDDDTSGSASTFSLGGLDLYASHQINDKTTGFVELVFEHNGQGFVSDLERLWVRHRFSEALNVSGGRFHTPIGYWNRSLHHGSFLQDTVGRPFFMDFEDGAGGILPVHIIGVMFTGDIWLDSGSVGYELGIGNGPALNTTSFNGTFSPVRPEIDANNIADTNQNKSVVLRTTYTPEDIDLQIALFGMVHSISESSETGGQVALGATLFDQQIFGFDLFYEGENIDVISEFFSITNDSKFGNNNSYTGDAFYVQLGYRYAEDSKVYYRFAALNFDNADSYFRILNTQKQSHNVIGMRYEVDEVNAIKFEYDKLSSDTVGLADSGSIKVQWSFLIP